ncbi:MAG: hypothetical protein AAB654_05465, partial [Acidobacteriota bacterium]
GLPTEYVLSGAADGGRLWFGGGGLGWNSGVVFSFESSNEQVRTYLPTMELGWEAILKLWRKNDSILAASYNAEYRIALSTGSWYRLEPARYQTAPLVVAEGKGWRGGYTGLEEVDLTSPTPAFRPVESNHAYGPTDAYSQATVSALAVDGDRLWIANETHLTAWDTARNQWCPSARCPMTSPA